LYDFVGLQASENQESKIWDQTDYDGNVRQYEDVFMQEGATIAGVNLKRLLLRINQRIEKLLDRDHSIGHSYFIDVYRSKDPMAALKLTFQKNVLPLLQEYFYGDFGKIGLVLGEPFVSTEKQSDFSFARFQAVDENLRGDYESRIVYKLTAMETWKKEDFIAIYE